MNLGPFRQPVLKSNKNKTKILELILEQKSTIEDTLLKVIRNYVKFQVCAKMHYCTDT
jgi:hypothetical protein